MRSRATRLKQCRAAALGVCLAVASSAGADPPSKGGGTKRAMAEALFQEAKALMEEGRFDAACAKLEESQRLDPAGGTLLNLARCYERAGKLATAWARFHDALAVASRDGVAVRVQTAKEAIERIAPSLSHLVVETPTSPPDGLTVSLDGVALGRVALGAPIPVDSGEHELEAAAPDHEPWRTRIMIDGAAKRRTVTIPSLVPTPPAEPPSPAPEPAVPSPAHVEREPAPDAAPPSPPEPDRTAAYVVGGVGLVALGAGAYFGVRAIDLRSQSDDECRGSICSKEAERLNDDAITSATLADVLIGAGLVGVGVGVYLYVSADVEQAPSTAFVLAPNRDGRGGRVGLSTRW